MYGGGGSEPCIAVQVCQYQLTTTNVFHSIHYLKFPLFVVTDKEDMEIHPLDSPFIL